MLKVGILNVENEFVSLTKISAEQEFQQWRPH